MRVAREASAAYKTQMPHIHKQTLHVNSAHSSSRSPPLLAALQNTPTQYISPDSSKRDGSAEPLNRLHAGVTFCTHTALSRFADVAV